MQRVLLVEDDAPFRRSLQSYLERSGYDVVNCATARRAIELHSRAPFDLAVIEYHLPDANGADLGRRLMLMRPDLRVVMISFYDYDLISREVRKAGVQGFLKKPFDPAEFDATLKMITNADSFHAHNAVPVLTVATDPLPVLSPSGGTL